MIKTVILDLDDTLYPEADYILSGFRACATALAGSLGGDKRDIYRDLCALYDADRRDVFGRYVQDRHYPAEWAARCVELYRGHAPDIALTPQARGFLEEIKGMPVKTALLTDGRPEGQRAKIAALGIERFFDAILVTDELGGVEFRKPSETGYRLVLEKLCVKPEEAVYIGDNAAKDFYAPNRMGMAAIQFTGWRGLYRDARPEPGWEAQYRADTYPEVIRIIDARQVDS